MGSPREFEPQRASSAEWELYHAFRRRRHEEGWPDEPFTPDHVREAELVLPSPFTRSHRWYIVEGGEMASFLEAHAATPESPEYESSKHLMWTEAWVLEPHRRRGVGRSWLPKLLELADLHRATVISLRAHDESGEAFLRWLGADARFREAQNRLDLRQVDWQLVSRWISEGRERSAETRLEVYSDGVPAAMFDEFSHALTDLLRLIPWEEAEHGELIYTPDTLRDWYGRLEAGGGVHHVILARELDGSISGLTDVVKYRHELGFVRQQLTAVKLAAQGRGIGKWLKAAMLEHLREAYPDTVYVTTENARSNAPMLAINHRLGFRLHRPSVDYQITRDALAQRAESLA